MYIHLSGENLHSSDGKLVNDTVVADPLFTAPVMGGAQFCYEIHGIPDTTFNLVSDKCTSVNARYIPMNVAENGNIIGAIGIRAADSDGNCHNIEVRLSEPGSSSPLEVLVNGVEVSGATQIDTVRLRKYSDRVRIAVPNCELVDLVMWVMYMEVGGQDRLKFVIMRGCNLAPTSHGLVGKIDGTLINSVTNKFLVPNTSLTLYGDVNQAILYNFRSILEHTSDGGQI